jgi:hypothetical protein
MAPRVSHVRPCLPEGEGSGAVTYVVAPDPASPLRRDLALDPVSLVGRAPKPPRVSWLSVGRMP